VITGAEMQQDSSLLLANVLYVIGLITAIIFLGFRAATFSCLEINSVICLEYILILNGLRNKNVVKPLRYLAFYPVENIIKL
jgi:hypothetical protein